MADYLTARQDTPAVKADLALLAQEYGREDRMTEMDLPIWDASAPLVSAQSYLDWLIDRDRKSRALKSLQGKIWQLGYETGQIVAPIYEDVVQTLREWKAQGGRTYLFSSGSVLAQQLLFRHSDHGDLSPLLDGYFDTGIGSKRETTSYTFIAETVEVPPQSILFVSDVVEELNAAKMAGLRVSLSLRPGNLPVAANSYPAITHFGQLQTLLDRQ
jgi:enolase-phosphatase E1